MTPFRIYPDKSFVEAFKCLFVARRLRIPVELVSKGSSSNSTDTNDTFVSNSAILSERPLLMTLDGPIFSTRAICFFFAFQQPKSLLSSDHSSFATTSGAAASASSLAKPNEYWKVGEWVDWTQTILQPQLDGVSRLRIIDCLQILKNNLTYSKIIVPSFPNLTSERTVDKKSFDNVTITTHIYSYSSSAPVRFLVSDVFTLADVFVWTSLLSCRLTTEEIANANVSSVLDYFTKIYREERENIISVFNILPHDCDMMKRFRRFKEIAEKSMKAYLKNISFSAETPDLLVLGKEFAASLPKPVAKEMFYLTTAINYTNGPPHMGHAYESIASDVISRYHRVYGRNVFFLTGSDEHGQKIHSTAEKLGMDPIDMCTMYAEGFKKLNSKLNVRNDFYIRTTMLKHKKTCEWLWGRAVTEGAIYLDKYCGWYNEREETFVTENEARELNYVDVVTGKPLQKMEEPSYFFRMSKYYHPLLQHIKKNPKFIQPEIRRNDILTRLQREPLMDLSISRTTFQWGIQVPDDPQHVMYVWFDALANYISGIDYPFGLNTKFWPPDVHVIGKDITWFHCVIWPTILMSVNIKLPKVVFAHGFISAADGRKMSKSLGNVIDPMELLEEFSADTIRFYIMKESKFGADLRFDVDAMIDAHNGDLADTLGNLVHRTTSLCHKYCNGIIPNVGLPEGPPPFDFLETRNELESLFSNFCIQEALELCMQICRDTNKYLTNHSPWLLTCLEEQQKVVRAVLEAVYIIAHCLEPFVCTAAEAIFQKLNSPCLCLKDMSFWFENLLPGTAVDIGDILFEKRKLRVSTIFIQKVEIRIGEIIEVDEYPKDKTSWILTLKINEDDSSEDQNSVAIPTSSTVAEFQRCCRIDIVTSLRSLYTKEDLKGRRVLVVCNMKTVMIGGVKVTGKVLCYSGRNDSLRFLEIDADVPPLKGSLVEAKGYPAVLRNRENVTRSEVEGINLQQRCKQLLFDGHPLHLGQGGASIVALEAEDGIVKIL